MIVEIIAHGLVYALAEPPVGITPQDAARYVWNHVSHEEPVEVTWMATDTKEQIRSWIVFRDDEIRGVRVTGGSLWLAST